ncbi:MAG: di-heme oxidoredictase family protein [Betaproteobacteria bacterium]
MHRTGLGGGLAILAVGGAIAVAADELPEDTLSAGSYTVARFDRGAFSEPVPGLPYREHERFLRGRHHFQQRWVQFPSLGGDWGLGPTYITNRCTGCHVEAGRGRPPEAPGEQPVSLLLRISVPGVDAHGGPLPHPHYGDQIQNQGLMGQDRDDTFLGDRVPPEAEVFLDWETREVAFADGETVPLRRPRIRFGRLWFGDLGDSTLMSLRLAQPIHGLGLLEVVPEETILAIAEAQRRIGFNGRPNYVRDDILQREALGRFGWKANQPSLAQQIASAYAGDLGVTSSLYPAMNCPPVQKDCAGQPPGNQPELIDSDWQEILFWEQALAVPARRNTTDPLFRRGEQLFAEARCAVCHVPELVTAREVPHLKAAAAQKIRAYTDLLLHDMGDDLADGRPDFRAGGRDWRTQPLWGLGLSQVVSGSTALLHDGRARTIPEAILWHGGEALASREAFRRMPRADREALIRFLESI